MKTLIFKFSNGSTTVELTAKSYTEASQLVPYGYQLFSIDKI